MRLRAGAQAWWHMLLLSLLCAGTAVLAANEPSMAVTTFEHLPFNIKYFEDSDVIVFYDILEQNVYRSSDAGFSWKKVSTVPERAAFMLVMHTFEPKTAFILTKTDKHFKSEDRGETWTEFHTKGAQLDRHQREPLVFHADDPKRIIFNGEQCDIGFFCSPASIYTTDGFKTSDTLRPFSSGCWWAKSTKEFTTGDKDLDLKRIMCVVSEPFSLFTDEQRLTISDSFFTVKSGDIDEFEPNLNTNKGVIGVSNLAIVKSFVLVATMSPGSDEMALYVSDDTKKWHRAVFPSDDDHDHSHRIYQGAYTVLESTNYSVQVDVRVGRPSNPTGVLFTSNSNGTYFTENIPYTNRDEEGHVDFEKISGIQGVFMVNVVENGADVEKKGASKEVVSKITFDDGRTFESIKAGKEGIHLHSITDVSNLGRIFSSPAPGLVMANGNTGKSLGKYADSKLYVSDDSGLNWKEAREGPHKYEFGDSGSILVAVKDTNHPDVGEIAYSLNHGEKWETVAFPDGLKIRPGILTTTQDSTSTKFLLVGDKEGVFYMVAMDFDKLYSRTCEDKDMEDWNAREDEDGKAICIMGHKQTYRRRKKDADCFIRSKFKDPVATTENCECTDMDFECDYNFQRDPEDKKVCKQVGPIIAPEGACKGSDDTFKGSSGWRLIPGNTCKRTDGPQKDARVERKCSDVVTSPSPPASGNITHTQHKFESKVKNFQQKFYLERSDTSSGTDETIIIRPAEDNGKGGLHVDEAIWLSSDHGKTWKQILKGETIQNIQPHPQYKDVIYFTTSGEKVIYTIDRGETFHSFEAPTKNTGFLSFHPTMKDWLIWMGEKCEKIGGRDDCYNEASISTDRGDNWRTMLRYVDKCEFTGHESYKFRPLKQIVCLAREKESHDAPSTIFSSDDFFNEDKYILGKDVNDFATMSEFIIVAERKETGDVRALASLDGKTYSQAHYPHNFHESHDDRYTVLDSSTHAVNLFVRTEKESGREYGSIIKSNSNGTSYVLSASYVNSNSKTFVDFEKVAGLEGVALINMVANPGKGEKKKKLQTKISHNDGAEWGYLPPPEKDVNGKSFGCYSDKGDSSCALHLHHYTERDDRARTFAATTAVGLLFGVGNVGSELSPMSDADTFMSTDGGISWRNVKKGHWTWQYGDQGSIIVLVERATSGNDVTTQTVAYSLDEGKTWTDYQFSDKKVTVLDITTLRTGNSRNFLLWCRSGDDIFSVNIDFTGLTDKPCKYTEGDDSDYYLWSPKHPLQADDCVFGHVAWYLRKKPERKCYNDENMKRARDPMNCECSRRDYECAYNFEMDPSGQCKLVPGLNPLSGEEWCKQHPNETSWFEPTGYRKLPLSTCVGGNELDKASEEHPCAGHEEEFEKKHRTSGFVIFLAIVIPFGLAGAAGWYVYRNWNGKFGQIRLGEQSSAFDSDQPWIKYPVIAVSALAAMAAALPLVVTSIWRTATGAYERIGGRGSQGRSWLSGGGTRRYTTRDSFSRGRADLVDETEGELLGEDSDEEF